MANGLPVEGEAETALVKNRLARDWPVCRLTDTASDAKQRAQAIGASFCPVVNDEGIVLGVVGKEASERSESVPVETIMDPQPRTLRPSMSVDDATDFLEKQNLDAVLITTSDGKLMGIFKRTAADEKKQLPKSEIWA